MDRYERVIKKEGKGKLAFIHPMMHARGLGDKRPAQFGKEGLAEFRAIPLKVGMTFVLKPRARNARTRQTGQLGDSVVLRAAMASGWAPGRWSFTSSDRDPLKHRNRRTAPMSNITLAQASIIVDKALEKAREMKFSPLAVVVLDCGGNPVVLKREDNSSLLRHKIATAKAWGVLGMGEGGRKLRGRAQANPAFFGVLTALSDGNIVPNPGGVLVRDGSGAIIGSVGISGDTGENDEACAVAGIKAAGLTADTGE